MADANATGAIVTPAGASPVASPAASPASAAAPGETLVKSTAGDSVPAKIHALHAAHFNGTLLANRTDLWNLVFDFKQKVIGLVEEAYADVKAKL